MLGLAGRPIRRFRGMLRAGNLYAVVRSRCRPCNANRRDRNRDRNEGRNNGAWTN
jgi:hypothetical protein